METVFYESDYNTFVNAGMNNMNQLKRKMTLNLNTGGMGEEGKPTSVIKKAKVVASLNTPQNMAVLSSPDLNMLKLASPELERLIIQQTAMLPTPTPTQTQIFFPRNVTEEQELYVRGFTDALSKLQNQSGGELAINNSNNNNTLTHNNISTAPAVVPQAPPTTTITTTISNLNIPGGQLQLLQNQQQFLQQQKQQQQQQQVDHPPPPAYSYERGDDSSDVSAEDSMSESSCSDSTTSSSTYTTNGPHVSVPTSSILSLGGGQQNSFPVLTAHHRLPDYQMSMSAVGATGTSGTIPVSAAAMGSSHHNHHVHIKDEPQTVPSVSSSPPMSPIDMASQEKIKLERKRQRNRVAASKCRKRKLERISKLEDKVKLLKGENSDLTNVLTKLKETVCHLKQQVMEHVNSGCQIIISQNANTSTSSY